MAIRPTPRLRSRTYRAFTRLPGPWVDRVSRGTVAAALVDRADRLLEPGPIRVSGGHGKGLELATGAIGLRHVQAYGLSRGQLEPSVQEALRRTDAPGSCVYDIGANVGFFSLLAARLAGPDGEVHAFEPSPADAEAVAANACLNRLSITVHRVAVAVGTGHAPFQLVTERSWSHLSERGEHPGTTREIDVEVRSLDDLVAGGLRPPDVLKIDVEGSEVDVLRGARSLLRTHGPTVICELHETNREFVAEAERSGYVLSNLDGTAPVLTAGPVHVLGVPARGGNVRSPAR